MCRRELALSELYVDAALTGDRERALGALLLDPMVTDIDSGRAILDDLLIEFADYLPQFENPPRSPQSIGGKLTADD